MRYSLSTGDAERLAEWFLHRLSMDQRHELMADMPLVYARVFPTVAPSMIADVVNVALDEQSAKGCRP